MTCPRPGRYLSRRQRLGEILRLLRGGVDRVEDLARAVEVSESTIRRDLAALEEAGEIARTYGGALPSGVYRETLLGERMTIAVEAKTRIGARAATWVEPGSTIFVDAGSTCAQLVAHLGDPEGLTVVTRGLEIATLLADRPVRVVLTGGTVSPSSHGLTGPITQRVLERFAVDVAFLGCDAIHPVRGVGEPTIEEAATKEMAAHAAGRTIVLAHADKLTTTGVPAWAPLPPGWTLVTDTTAAQTLEPFHRAGVEVVSVPAPN